MDGREDGKILGVEGGQRGGTITSIYYVSKQSLLF